MVQGNCGNEGFPDGYAGCKFAVETVNGGILAFDPDFQQQVYRLYKEKYGVDDETVIRFVDADNTDFQYDDADYERDIGDDMYALGVACDEGAVIFEDKVNDREYNGFLVQDILEELGMELAYDEDDSAEPPAGVYYIR